MTETTQHRTEMQRSSENWQHVELAKRDKVIADLSAVVEANDEVRLLPGQNALVHE